MKKRLSKMLLTLCIMCITFVTFSLAASAAYVTYIVGSGSEGMGTVGISTDGGSTVTKGNVNQLTVSSGTTVILYAYPNSGYSVDTIGGFIGTSSASLSPVPYGGDGTYVAIFTMGSDNFIGYASFEENTTYYTITATSSDSTMGTVSGGGTVVSGSSVTLAATAKDGYVFTGWYNGDTLVSSNASYTVSSVTADATYTAKFAKAVAKIGDTYYASLAEAIAAVPTTGVQTTVTLLSDANLGKSALTIAATQNVDLDLGGFTLSGGSAYYCVENHGTMVIHNGTVNATSYMGIVGKYGHTTTLADITVNHSGNLVAVGALGGDLIINSGTVINASGSVPLGAQYYNQTAASITVNGGVINGGGIGLYTDPTKITITLNGGTFDTYEVTDQSYNTDVGTLSNYVAEGKSVIEDDGLYYVGAVARVGNVGYATLSEAVDAAEASNGTVVLLTDVTGPDAGHNYTVYVNEGSDITIDLNGHTLTDDYLGAIWAYGSVTVKNGTIKGGDGNNAFGIFAINTGSAIIENVTIENFTYAVSVQNGGVATINSGTFNGSLYTSNGGTITINDGTFTADPSAYVAEGKIITYDGTYYTITDSVPANAVAKVGDMYYTSLQAAVDAAEASGVETTITLLSDVDESVTIENANVIIDLANHTWTSTTSNPVIINSGSVVLKNGTVSTDVAATIAVDAQTTASLVLEDVTVSGKVCSLFLTGEGDGSIVVDGNSTISATNYAMLMNSGTITVNSGDITGDIQCDSGTIVVNGGTFTADPSAYVAEGTPVAKAEDGTYIVNASNVTVTANPTEGGSVSGDGIVNYGESITLVATPAEGYKFKGWYDGDTIVSTDATYTVASVTASKTYTAKFVPSSQLVASDFAVTTDSGYYGEYEAPESGIIAFNAVYNDYEGKDISKFGLFIFLSGNNQVTVEAGNAADLIANLGKFYATVSDIPVDNFETQVYAKPYVVIDDIVYYGNTVSATVNADKWLGTQE